MAGLVKLPAAAVVVLVAVLGVAVAQPSLPTITFPTSPTGGSCDGSSRICCISDRSNYNLRFTCAANDDDDDEDNDYVYWVVRGYQMVDPDEYIALGVTFPDNAMVERAGALVENAFSSVDMVIANSPPSSMPRDDVFNRSDSNQYVISCMAVDDFVHIRFTDIITMVDQNEPAVMEPEWTVTECGADGKISLTITYEVLCPSADFDYTLTLTNDGTCGTVMKEGSMLRSTCSVSNVADLDATLMVTSLSWEFTHRLSGIGCSNAVYNICSNELICEPMDGITVEEGWGCKRANDEFHDTFTNDMAQSNSRPLQFSVQGCGGSKIDALDL